MTTAFATVSAIANAVRSGAVTAISVVEGHLARIEETQPAINAFTLVQQESALRRGRSRLTEPPLPINIFPLCA